MLAKRSELLVRRREAEVAKVRLELEPEPIEVAEGARGENGLLAPERDVLVVAAEPRLGCERRDPREQRRER